MIPCKTGCDHYCEGCHKTCPAWKELQQRFSLERQKKKNYLNYYNDLCWSWAFVTWDEKRQCRVIEVAQNDFNSYTSFLRDRAVPVPDDVETVWLRTRVRTQTYGYDYSFDGEQWHDLGVELDAKILSDDYVNQRYGGFFTGAFVGLAAVDLSGYAATAEFVDFDYRELSE